MVKRFFIAGTVFFLSACFFHTAAQVRMPRIIRDSMVLQRDAPMKLWGWASANEKVSVQFSNKSYKTTAGSDGRWQVLLSPLKAGGPYTLHIDASNHITLKEILIGDVWLCAGQSNMVHQMELHGIRYAADIASANYPQIRQFWVPNIANMQGPQDDLPGGSWKWANPKDVGEFSAVAYFFARKLYEKYGVPIGLINASWGGVPIEAMMSEAACKDFPAILNVIQKNKDTAFINSLSRRATTGPRPLPRPQDKGISESWFAPSYIPKNWRPINIPGYWEDQGVKDVDGVVWYRREINIPASIAGTQAKVFLGRIVDADVLYINGKQVGATGYMYPQRRYQIPAGLLKAGKNLFVVRVTNNSGKGGFVPDKPYYLTGGSDTVDLKGEWQYKVGQVNDPLQRSFGGGIAAQNQPTALYNAMLAPLINFAVKGFVWYQGESNTGRPDEYARLQPAMIADWRQKWNNPGAPFLFVQLPGFGDMTYLPTEAQWAAFRDAQKASLSVPATGMAVAIDLGEWNDIHPDRKKEVGERLALAAEKVAYGDNNVVYSGPMYQSATASGAKIILSFSNIGSGLITNDGEELSGFTIAGEDKKFVWAKAKIEGDKIQVWTDEIRTPKWVRYAWSDNPVDPNLYNKEGLPASPFRTDN